MQDFLRIFSRLAMTVSRDTLLGSCLRDYIVACTSICIYQILSFGSWWPKKVPHYRTKDQRPSFAHVHGRKKKQTNCADGAGERDEILFVLTPGLGSKQGGSAGRNDVSQNWRLRKDITKRDAGKRGHSSKQGQEWKTMYGPPRALQYIISNNFTQILLVVLPACIPDIFEWTNNIPVQQYPVCIYSHCNPMIFLYGLYPWLGPHRSMDRATLG